jgi:hypothetical protein
LLILPPLDFSKSTSAGLRFKVAYADNLNNDEVLRVWASVNDGFSFDYLIRSFANDNLITAPPAVNFVPTSTADWVTKFIDLTTFAGEENILLAFEVTDGDGGNLYLDDIDLLVSADPAAIELEPGKMAIYPNPLTNYAGNITFSLEEKQDIRVRIIDMRGNTVSDQIFNDVINQTYVLELASELNGLYLIQAIGSSFASSSRIVLNR